MNRHRKSTPVETPERKVRCVWCGASFAYQPCAKTCGFQCSLDRSKDMNRAWSQRRRNPSAYRAALAREKAALKLTWQRIDALFGPTFEDIHRGP